MSASAYASSAGRDGRVAKIFTEYAIFWTSGRNGVRRIWEKRGCWRFSFVFSPQRYEATLKKRNVVDYDDMLLLCAQVLPFGQ